MIRIEKIKSDITPTSPKTIWWLYFIALGIVVIELSISLVVIKEEVRLIEEDSFFLAMAGRQGMLSQRILHHLEHGYISKHDSEYESVKRDIYEFEAIQDEYLNTQKLPAKAIPTNTTYTPPRTDMWMEKFIEKTKEATNGDIDLQEIGELQDLVVKSVFPATEKIVSSFGDSISENVHSLNETIRNAIIIAIFILCLEAAFVFLPAQRMILRSLRQIEEKNAHLRSINSKVEEEKERLQKAISEAESLRQEQAEFTYAISHDLKSPANTIKMVHGELCELLKDHQDEEVKMFLDILVSTTDRMVLLVEDVLDYTTTLGKIQKRSRVPLNDLFSDLVQDLSGDIKDANGTVHLGKLPEVFGCPTQLRMLFQNLISNAIKFRRSGVDSYVSVDCLGNDKGQVSLQICDNGIGIAKEDQDQVFGLFSKLHLREEFPGTGLGLALCRRIVANHSGKISLKSEVGEGSRFIVSLPQNAA